MDRIDGTSAHQLDLLERTDSGEATAVRPTLPRPVRPALRLLRRDVYAELARRRRRAQIAARHELERE